MTYRPRPSDWMRVAVVGLVLVGWGVAAHSYPITVVSAFAPAPPAPHRGGAPWPMASHDVGHSGRSPNQGPTTGRLRWIRRLEGNVTPGPVVGVDGTIYLASNAGILHALDPATGADIWTVKAEGESGTDLSASPAILDSGVIAWPTSGHAVQGVSPQGKVLWTVDLPAIATSPMPLGNRLYVMSMDGSLTAVELADDDRSARIAWTISLGSITYASPAISSTGLIVTNVGNDAVGLRDRGAKPEVVWRTRLGTLSEISPAIGPGGTVVTGGNDRWIQQLSATGRLLARYNRDLESYSSPVVTDGVVVQGNHHAAVVALDLRKGEYRLRVQHRVDRPGRGVGIWTAPVLDRDANIYVGTQSGQINAWSWSGRRLFTVDAGSAFVDSYPALTADGALIVGDTNGVVRAIADDGNLPASAPAPAR